VSNIYALIDAAADAAAAAAAAALLNWSLYID